MSARARCRARVFLRAALPLLEVIAKEREDVARRLSGVRGTVAFAVAHDAHLRACLRFDGLGVTVPRDALEPTGHADTVCTFRDVTALNAFFAGKPVLPHVGPRWGLGHMRLLAKTAQLLTMLRVLEPPVGSARARLDQNERALRVRLVLYLVTSALSQLHRDGFEPVTELAQSSPDRVYQWSVTSSPELSAYLRMHQGRVKAGRGIYRHKTPFVHFEFPDINSAFDVMMATGSQMTSFRGGSVRTVGSPEYVRKMALLMQQVDELLVVG